MAADLHPDLQALAPLLGTWQGRGSGEYPTIEPFDYVEEVAFSHVGKPFLVYGQKTRAAADGAPLHAETGYLRVPRPGHVELVLAHPSGITEIEVGTYMADGTTIELEMTDDTDRSDTDRQRGDRPWLAASASTATSSPIRCRWAPSDNRCSITSPRCCTAKAECLRFARKREEARAWML